ncbi:hypothetical protein [Bombilactobacillus mellis]|uniref:hypothetical protein n=1 Tax=Bombilactobacillus mellis TaxID=1218508 RepID=UPI001580520A|nr:hypothetical protein [Bombilactobacillus mellis]NUF24868.1 hypothetical protein [Bombilactobacillus mellis]
MLNNIKKNKRITIPFKNVEFNNGMIEKHEVLAWSYYVFVNSVLEDQKKENLFEFISAC